MQKYLIVHNETGIGGRTENVVSCYEGTPDEAEQYVNALAKNFIIEDAQRFLNDHDIEKVIEDFADYPNSTTNFSLGDYNHDFFALTMTKYDISPTDGYAVMTKETVKNFIQETNKKFRELTAEHLIVLDEESDHELEFDE